MTRPGIEHRSSGPLANTLLIRSMTRLYDLILLSNTPVQAKFLLHNLEQVAGDTGLYANVNKTD